MQRQAGQFSAGPGRLWQDRDIEPLAKQCPTKKHPAEVTSWEAQ